MSNFSLLQKPKLFLKRLMQLFRVLLREILQVFYFFPYKISIFILSIALILPPLYAPQWLQDEDESSKVEIIRKSIEQNLYTLSFIDSFSAKIQWRIYRSVSNLNRTELVPLTPNKIAFKEESIMIEKFNYDDDSKSFMIQSFLDNPGKQHLEIRPENPIKINDGLPIKIVLWVYANHYDIRLKIIFTQKHSKDFHIDFGTLDFDGWKRIEKEIVLPQKNIKLLESLQHPLYLKSIGLFSGPLQKKGEFFIYLDRMYILALHPANNYPGADIKDNWEKKY